MVVLVFLGLSLFAGFMLANQNPINADMKKVVGSPFISAAISFLIGSIFLGILSAIMSHRVFPSGSFISSNPAWIWLGGVLGAVYLTSNVLLFPRLGAIQTVILPILGQILMGTIIDTFGWFGTAQTPLTLMRVIGLIVLIAGVVVAVVLPNVLNKEKLAKHSMMTAWLAESTNALLCHVPKECFVCMTSAIKRYTTHYL